MTRVLVTGGTGVLGRDLVRRLIGVGAGHTVRVMSRQAAPPPELHGVEWSVASLRSGRGLREAVAGVDVIVHAATSPFRQTHAVDVDGTRRLLTHAAAANVKHFIYVSIVGIDQIPLGYYRSKLAAEGIVARGSVPWTILRATQFHSLLDRQLTLLARFPLSLLPTDFRFQPVDAGEVAARLAEVAIHSPTGRVPDLGGPRVHTMGELARIWLDVRGLRRRIFHLPLPGRVAEGFRRGFNTAPAHADGKITWEEWVRRRYAMVLK